MSVVSYGNEPFGGMDGTAVVTVASATVKIQQVLTSTVEIQQLLSNTVKIQLVVSESAELGSA